jgi:hypothetical protein
MFIKIKIICHRSSLLCFSLDTICFLKIWNSGISLGTSGDGNDEIIGNFFNKSLLEEITLFENGRICKNKGNSVDKRSWISQMKYEKDNI